MDANVQWAFEETHRQLPDDHHRLLCIGAWLFQANELTEVNWELYRLVFHEQLEEEREHFFAEMKRQWNTKEELEIQNVKQEWHNMIVSTSSTRVGGSGTDASGQ